MEDSLGEILEGDPAEVGVGIAEGAAEAEFIGGEHLGQCSALGSED